MCVDRELHLLVFQRWHPLLTSPWILTIQTKPPKHPLSFLFVPTTGLSNLSSCYYLNDEEGHLQGSLIFCCHQKWGFLIPLRELEWEMLWPAAFGQQVMDWLKLLDALCTMEYSCRLSFTCLPSHRPPLNALKAMSYSYPSLSFFHPSVHWFIIGLITCWFALIPSDQGTVSLWY